MTIAESPGATAGEVARVDPVTFEVVRHRLWGMADEMAMTLIRTAGNPSITEVHDFMVALFTPDGDIAMGGWGGNRHVSCTAQACRGILARFPADEIHENDVFLLNDPYVAAIHQQDVYVISPVHFEGRLVGWVGNFTHLSDIGGIDPGTSPRATDVRQEGLRIPGLKLADRGVLRADVWDTLLNMTREPEMNALQLKAQMAANNTGKEKLRALLARIGTHAYETIVARMIAQSEQALRARLRQLPDGTWRTREYLDTKDRMYRIVLAMTKAGDRLIFDFTGTSEQASNFINCTYWGTRGGIFVSVSSMLGYGLPWNEGLLKPLSLIVPEGTLLNCQFPAPMSMGTVAGSRMATVASWNTVSSMLAMSEALADEMSASWTCAANGIRVSGIGRENRSFVYTPGADAGGAGARRFADGVDASGTQNNPMQSITNVETIERDTPVLYVFRRQSADTGGPGTFRGGVATELAWTAHKAPRAVLTVVTSGSGREPAMAQGTLGGLPAGNTLCELRAGTRLREALRSQAPLNFETIGGEVQPVPLQGLVDVAEEDLFYCRSDGGGGLGDPLLRQPERVLGDVQAGLVSAAQARLLYGVVLDGAEAGVDTEATGKVRQAIRAGRLGSAAAPCGPAADAADGPARAPVVYDHERAVTRCAACGWELGPLQEDWKRAVVERSQPLAELGSPWTSTLFVLRSFSCPGCGVLLDSEMTLPEDPPVHRYSPVPRGD
jgi:N-methylhydantoinase B